MDQVFNLAIDFLNSLWSRRWYAIAVAWLICIIGWSSVAVMPDQYRSSARIFVDTTSLLQPILRGIAIDVSNAQELNLIRQTLLSRQNIEKVMRMTDLDLGVTTEKGKENLISKLRSRTSFRGSDRNNFYTIAFSSAEPERAREVVQAFTTVFVESNIGANRDDTEVAREFLAEQTGFYRQKLEESEARLAEFKKENAEILPESVGAVGARLLDTRSGLNEAVARRDELKRQLASVDPFIETGSNDGGFGSGPPSLAQAQIAELEAQIEVLLVSYTEKHPDVIIAQRKLKTIREKFQAQQEAADAIAAQAQAQDREVIQANVIRESNPVYETLKVELVRAESNIGSLRQRLSATEAKWKELQERTEQRPFLVNEQIKLQRDYGIVKSKYNQLLERQEAMSIATERTIKSDDIKFRIIDPPRTPLGPSGPDRAKFLMIVLGFAVVAGLSGAAALAFIRKTFQSTRSLRASFAIPVYGSVADVNTKSRRRKVYLDLMAITICTGSLAGLMMVLLILESRIGLPNIISVESAPQSFDKLRIIIQQILNALA